jgi:fluoroacetyl-CoA thioesterase
MEPGLHATIEDRVTESMTAEALGSGDVPVLGTPAVLALAERAALAALEGHLEEDHTTVGSWIELSHLAPTRVGETVTAHARLTEAAGRHLSFEISVADPSGEIANARHRRVIVHREEFLSGADARSS